MNEINEKKKPEVFAFVPSYNHAPFIEKCLRSIAAQTLPPSKLLVIDDGSKDDSPKIIEKVLKECAFDTELIVRTNRGLCATLNEGYKQSAGEYFAYLGSDDLWFSEFLARRVKLLNENPNAVLGYGNALFLDEAGEIFESSAEWWNFPTDARAMLRLGIAPISSTVFIGGNRSKIIAGTKIRALKITSFTSKFRPKASLFLIRGCFPSGGITAGT